MVGKIIRDYMEGGARKLTVPGFGTFMRRDGGEVIFVDLLRGDDRVLTEMVEDAGPFTEVEAMARIDRFIFETRNAIERTGRATIADFGTMTADGKGVYRFDYSPREVPVPENATPQRLFDPSAAVTPQTADLPSAAAGGERSAMDGRQAAGTSREAAVHPAQAQVRAERDAPARPRTEQAAPARPRSEGQARPQDGARTARAHGSATRTGSAHGPAARRPHSDAPRGKIASGRKPNGGALKSSATDRVLLFAIIAAALALAAMIFGLTSSAGGPFGN